MNKFTTPDPGEKAKRHAEVVIRRWSVVTVTVDGTIAGLSVAHQYANVETIAAASPEKLTEHLERLLSHDGISEAFVLNTCNRVEWYVVTDHPQVGRAVLHSLVDGLPAASWRQLSHDEAIEHLLRVSTGLESQVLGEDEILGQVRAAYHTAKDHGGIDDLLEPVLMKALHVGERARSETGINEGVVSLASAAVRCAEEHVHLPTSSVAVIGAGDTGARAARSLVDRDVGTLVVLNRSVERAETVCESLDTGEARPLDATTSVLEASDVVITATDSTDPILTEAKLPETGSIIAIDLGQPPNVDEAVQNRATVAYYDLDRLRRITDRTHTRRRGEAEAVEELIEDELAVLQRRFKRARAEAVIGAMRTGAARIKSAEVERALIRLEDGESPPEEVLEDLADALVNALMAPPTEALRDAAEDDDWTTIASAIQIFDPDLDEARLHPELAEATSTESD